MVNQKCGVCGKTAYPLESVTAIEKTFHKACFKCTVCQMTLNLKNFKGFENQIYCATHYPKIAPTPQSSDSISIKSATSVPKKTLAQGVHKADPKVAPQASGDFTVNSVADQSTENTPSSSGITYESYNADQSTENAPSASGITYDAYNADQSTESNPSGGYDQQQYYDDQQ